MTIFSTGSSPGYLKDACEKNGIVNSDIDPTHLLLVTKPLSVVCSVGIYHDVALTWLGAL
jgi:hypothetical protein